jgi:hypothetical protein
MKKISLVFGVVCTLFVFACSQADTPSAVAKKFYEALTKNDAKAIGQYATPETAALVTTYGAKIQSSMTTYGKITEVTESIDGETASATLKFENDETLDLNLVKVDGKWKVAVDK